MPDALRNRKYYDLVDCFDNLYKDSVNGKKFYDLINIITMPENIMMAYRNIKRNSGSITAGVDGKNIEYLEKLTPDELIRRVQAKFRWYVPKPVKRVEIPKVGDPTKTRPLGIPCIMDRLVQQCIKQVLEPIAEAKFYENSFGFRLNRSAENAIAVSMHHMTHAVLHFVVDVDIKGFFDNVNHNKLMSQLWTMGIRDKKLLSIMGVILKTPIVMPDYTKIIPDKGTPQGGILSPLLANIYLNELDWWIATQWAEFPTKHNYTAKTSAHQSMRKYSKLKEMRIVRYADDFKIFCRTKSDAEVVYNATVLWLKERLKLDVSPEKSGITNLRKKYTDFLGIELKVRKKSELNVDRHVKGFTPKRWVVTSRVKPKAIKRIQDNLVKQLQNIQYPANDNEQARAIRIYNSIVMGEHNYYCMATQVTNDFASIQKNMNQKMFNRLYGLTKNKPKDATILLSIKQRYGQSKQMYYLKQMPIIPIGFVKFRTPLMPDRKVNEYSESGRKHKKVKLGCSEEKLRILMQQKVYGSIEYSDNRISLFSAQKGKCAILGIELDIDDIHCHHKMPKSMGGEDRYDNLVIVHKRIHVLIHATDPNTIESIVKEFQLSCKQIEKVNKYRDIMNIPRIDMRFKDKVSEKSN